MTSNKLSFASDYTRGAHPAIIDRLVETNLMKTGGYGQDPFSESAKQKIRTACASPDAEIHFLVGGTQTNAVVIGSFLTPFQGVIAADTGHINVHEAGAIEATGHKVLALPGRNGKLIPEDVRRYLEEFSRDGNREHMVMPGMIYLSQPTELGSLYTLDELREFRAICSAFNVLLYVDGARLAYALACPQNDVTLPDLASLCDIFYIGGTKCGALFGEAVVIPQGGRLPAFFTIIKQKGALLAKGRLLGLQFETLFTDDLYLRIGAPAIRAADDIRRALVEKGYDLVFDSPTNQVFCLIDNDKLETLGQAVDYSFWECYDETRSVIRLATDWSTTDGEVGELIERLPG